MKIRQIVEEFEDATLDEIVSSVFLNIEQYSNWNDTKGEIKSELNSGNYDLSEEEKEEVIAACEERFNLDLEEYRKEEIEKLSSRKKIINWINSLDNYDFWTEPGDVGYLLSTEEIVDLIYKNYNN